MKCKQYGNRYFFWCPGCDDHHAASTDWSFNGDFERPTFSPSILVNGSLSNPTAPRCHSFVRDGMIEFLNDCTHYMAGKTVELPDYEQYD